MILFTIKRYLTLSMGAIKLLLITPATPPDMKLFNVLIVLPSSFLYSLINILQLLLLLIDYHSNTKTTKITIYTIVE